MRNLIYIKIARKHGKIAIVEKIITQDLTEKISFSDIPSLNVLNIFINDNSFRIKFDCFNSLPLFWGEDIDGITIISNQYDKVAKEVNCTVVDIVGFWELYLFESPLLSRTLFEDISVSQSGHDLVIDHMGSRLERRFDFAYGQQNSYEDVLEKAHQLLSRKLNQSLENVIFPLSGGLDSRLILSYMNGSLSGKKQFLTYGFSEKIFENIYAQEILQEIYGDDYTHHFYTIESNCYLDAGLQGAIITGGFAGIQNSHLLGYAKQGQLTGATCILGMFADAIFGYAESKDITDWQTCAYAKKVKRFQDKGAISTDVAGKILNDLRILYYEWCDSSDISSFDEYIYIRERNGKFHTSLINALQDYWDVVSPLNDWDIIKFFISLPNEVRENKAVIKKIIRKYFPELSEVGDVSSSFRNSNSKIFHKLTTLMNSLLSRKLGLTPIIPIYTDTERHDYSFIKYYKDEYKDAIDSMKVHLKIDPASMQFLEKFSSGLHGFQFITNAQVIKFVLVSNDKIQNAK